MHRSESTDQTETPRRDRGAGFIEYALLLALMAFALLTAVDFLGNDTKESVDDSASSVASAG